MEPVKPSAVTPSKKLARNFAKVLHLRALIGIAPVDGLKNVISDAANLKDEGNVGKTNWPQSFDKDDDEELRERVAVEALIAKLFASTSTVKAAYAQLQYAQSPYDPDGIQDADQLIVAELKILSEIKQCYLKKQFDPSPEKVILAAESKELQSVIRAYEIMAKKLESQARLKESEIIFLREKLEEANKQNKSIEKRLNQSGQLSMLDKLHISGLNPSHFITVLRHTVRSVRSFVRLLVDEMRSADWDIDAVVGAIEQDVVYWVEDHKCFAIESYVCREMFDSFHFPNFSLPNESLPDDRNQRKQLFFVRFNELKSMKAREFLAMNQRSPFAKFCRAKYLKLVHPKMESSFFGDLSQRSLLSTSRGGFPDTAFFASFAEMAKRVYLLHCLAFSFEPQASIFQVAKGCRFSDVYMESVNDDMLLHTDQTTVESSDPRVAFTVVPGFRIGKTVIQCQVYLSLHQKNKVNKKFNSSRQR